MQRSSFKGWRHRLVAAFDATTWLLALLVVPALLDQMPQGPGAVAMGLSMAAAIAAALAVGRAAGLYTPQWSIAHPRDLLGVFAGVLGGAGVGIILFTAIGHNHPLGAVGSAGTAALAVQVFARAAWRFLNDRIDRRLALGGHPVIVFGAGYGGTHISESLLRDTARDYRVVALLDDDPLIHGRRIAGAVVEGGRERMAEVARQHAAQYLLIAIPSANSSLIRELSGYAEEAGLEVRTLPSMAELMGNRGAVQSTDIRDITPGDLLGRRPVVLDLHIRGRYVRNEVVLVTGAGGSIGSELCRQLARLGTETLLMLDRDESALHALQLSIEGKATLESERLLVADIRDDRRMRALFERWRPTVVFHAAALKHLTLLENAPSEAMKTNVTATAELLELSKEFGVQCFINVSTDKAADASSVLGYTKRMGEMLTAGAARTSDRQFLSVRFGNVLGSRGSVLTAFSRQIAEGGPVTVTDPDIERYFMTVEEAVGLVIAAGDIGRPGEVMILEMGEPVRILDVAEEMIEMAGAPCEIEFTGLRPGEKMSEKLFGEQEPIVMGDDGLMWHGSCPAIEWSDVAHLAEIDDPPLLRSAMHAVAGPNSVAADGPLPPIRTFLSPPDMTEIERGALLDAFDSNWIAPAGPHLDRFEAALAERTGAPGVLAVSSGTAALHLALLLNDVGPGDEVVVQTATFAATAFAVHHVGATPVFCDIDATTGNLDPELLAQFLSERAAVDRLPKAVIPVDLYGMCADYDRILEVCAPYGVKVIQDAAEALGSVSRGRAAGTHCDLGVLSFNGNKIITTSGGGALLGDPERLAWARKISAQAREPVLHYEHNEIGHNFRMSNLLASLGSGQLSRLDDNLAGRARIHDRYVAEIGGVGWFPVGVTETPNRWLNVALLPDRLRPEEVCAALRRRGIEARPAWKPMHAQPVFAQHEHIGGACAEDLFNRGLCLPSGASMTDLQQSEVIELVNRAVATTAAERDVDPDSALALQRRTSEAA